MSVNSIITRKADCWIVETGDQKTVYKDRQSAAEQISLLHQQISILYDLIESRDKEIQDLRELKLPKLEE